MFWKKKPHIVCHPGIRIHHWKITLNILQKKNILWGPSRTGSSSYLAYASWVSAMRKELVWQLRVVHWVKKISARCCNTEKGPGSLRSSNKFPTSVKLPQMDPVCCDIGQGRTDFHVNGWDNFPCKQDIRFIFALQ